MKMLRRHLRRVHGLTPEQYRARWGLPHDYPMVAPGYADNATFSLTRALEPPFPREERSPEAPSGEVVPFSRFPWPWG
jgi:hypothetical protein